VGVMSFYGGSNGVDYVCFDDQMKVVASGKLDSMLALAEKNNYAVGQLQTVRYRIKEPVNHEKRL
jgi:hypothetical protein